MSFESAATAERRPLSVTERAETRRHGEGTARSRHFNQSQREGRQPIHVSYDMTMTKFSPVYFANKIRDSAIMPLGLERVFATNVNVSMNFRC